MFAICQVGSCVGIKACLITRFLFRGVIACMSVALTSIAERTLISSGVALPNVVDYDFVGGGKKVKNAFANNSLSSLEPKKKEQGVDHVSSHCSANVDITISLLQCYEKQKVNKSIASRCQLRLSRPLEPCTCIMLEGRCLWVCYKRIPCYRNHKSCQFFNQKPTGSSFQFQDGGC